MADDSLDKQRRRGVAVEEQKAEAADELDDPVFRFADDVSKGLSRAQTLVQSFVDRNLSLPSLDRKRDASEWLEAGTKFAADAMVLWLQTAATIVDRTASMTGRVVGQAQRHLDDERAKGTAPDDRKGR